MERKPFASKPKAPSREKERKRARNAALKALRRARKAAGAAGVALSDWEGEFLGSVESRVETYGRAFRDWELGNPAAALSLRQSVKLKEIGAKAAGKKPAKAASRFRRSAQ